MTALAILVLGVLVATPRMGLAFLIGWVVVRIRDRRAWADDGGIYIENFAPDERYGRRDADPTLLDFETKWHSQISGPDSPPPQRQPRRQRDRGTPRRG